MTCMPIPAPPGGTIGVTFSSGILDIFSKKSAISVCSSTCSLFITMNSAHPGTNIGNTYCLCLSSFSQLYSISPITPISCSSSSVLARSLPHLPAISSAVAGTLTFMESATSAISSVTTPARPQYSGSSTVTLTPILSVIFCPSFIIKSRCSDIATLLSFFSVRSVYSQCPVMLHICAPESPFLSLIVVFLSIKSNDFQNECKCILEISWTV